MKRSPYRPAEDTELLRTVLRGYSGDSCLEIGAGSGGTLVELAQTFALAVGTDVARPDKLEWDGRRGNFVLSDSAACFRDASFDLVAFNPPYLPSETIEDIAVDGGSEGIEVPLRFLKEALRVMKRSGKVVMLLSSLDNITEIESECARRNVKLRKITEKRLFFECLYAFEVSYEQDRNRPA